MKNRIYSKQQKIRSTISIIVLALFIVILLFNVKELRTQAALPIEEEIVSNEGVQKNPDNLITEVMQQLEKQAKVDQELQKAVESGNYTIDNPLIVLDPYDASPLSGVLVFSTETPTKIEIEIKGKDDFTTVKHEFVKLSQEHIIPIVGLYENTVNIVQVKALTEDEEVDKVAEFEIKTEAITEDLNNLIILTRSDNPNYCFGINFLYTGRKMAFDKNGEIRWYLKDQDLAEVIDYQYINQKFMVAKGTYFKGDTVFFEMDKLGKIYSVFFAPYGVHHDIECNSSGNFLITGSNGETVEDFLYEIDYNTGQIIHVLDLKTVLQRTRKAYNAAFESGTGWADWLHNNSIVWSEDEKDIIISNNHQSTIAKLSWPDGEIKWLLADPMGWLPRLKGYLLKPIGSDFEYTYNQHAVEILPDYDNNSGTTDILVFDNGTSRYLGDKELQRQLANNEIVSPELYSRMVQYRIDEKAMTVKQVRQYGKERGEELFSCSVGDADLLNNGNWLGNFCIGTADVARSLILSEVSNSGELVWEAEIFSNSETGNYTNYRVERLPFYFEDEQEHDIYTEAQNLIPEEILKKYGVEN